MTFPAPFGRRGPALISRRTVVKSVAATAAAALIAPWLDDGRAAAQEDTDYEPGSRRYPDVDIITLSPRFAPLRLFNSAIQRLWTGGLWNEGPAWNGQGRYLVWSDIPNNRQLRWLEENGEVSVFRNPSNYSNGNTFDWQGRQISGEPRRAVRYEHSGAVTVIADSYEGRPLNTANDLTVHPDGGVWFSDHLSGIGSPGSFEGPFGEITQSTRQIYRADPGTGAVTRMTEGLVSPNGLCFNEDYTRLYVYDGAPSPNAKIMAYDVIDGTRLTNARVFSDLMGGPNNSQIRTDGMRVDRSGNLWGGAGPSPGVDGKGVDGVQIFAPDGERIGQILLPERGSNVAFGGPKRNRLFITASQSIYAVYVNTWGGHIC